MEEKAKQSQMIFASEKYCYVISKVVEGLGTI